MKQYDGTMWQEIYADVCRAVCWKGPIETSVIVHGHQGMWSVSEFVVGFRGVSMLSRQVRIRGPKAAAKQSHGMIFVSKGHSMVCNSQAFHYSIPCPSNRFLYCLCCRCPWSWTTALAKASWSHRPHHYMRTMTSSCGLRRWRAVLWNPI